MIALPLKRALGDRSAVASLLDGLGVGAYLRGDYKKGRAYCEEGLAIRRELGDGLLIARSLIDLGGCAAEEGELAEATRHLEEALTLFRAAGRSTGVSAVLGNLALLALRAGSASRCELLAREAIDVAERVGFVEAAKASKIVLSRALLALGDIDGAQVLARSVASDKSTPILLGDVARALASIAFARGELRLASRLLGAASSDPVAVPLAELEPHERLVGSLRASLGSDFSVEYDLGAAKGSGVFAALDFREYLRGSPSRQSVRWIQLSVLPEKGIQTMRTLITSAQLLGIAAVVSIGTTACSSSSAVPPTLASASMPASALERLRCKPAVNSYQKSAKHAKPLLYVAGFSAQAVFVYDQSEKSPAQPLYKITTGISDPNGIATDTSGNLYVTNELSNALTIYTPGGNLRLQRSPTASTYPLP